MAQTVFLALILKQLTYPDSLIYAQDYRIFYHTLFKKKTNTTSHNLEVYTAVTPILQLSK